jgi:hypothetical protein
MIGRVAHRRRRVAALAAAAVILGAAGTTLTSGAAFVDVADTDQPVTADTVTRWLGLEAPGAVSCAQPANSQTTGADGTLAVAVGGADATAGGSGRQLNCSFVLRARDTLPEGVTGITVGVARVDDAANPVTAAALTALDGTNAASTTALSPGQRAAVRMTVVDRPAARGELTLTVSFTGETSGFLQYRVPVDVCAAGLAATCVRPSDPDPGTPGTPGPGPGAGGTAPSGQTPAAPIAGTAPSTSAGTPKAPRKTARQCTSRRTIQIRLKRGWKIPGKVTVRVNGKGVRATRKGNRITARIDLRGLKKTTVTVKITARTATGRRVTDTRRYRTCVPKATKPATSKKKTPKRTSSSRSARG